MTAPDYLADSSCSIVPGTIPWGPGWYLIAANARVEAGPFPDEVTALLAADWLEESGLGVHPTFENPPGPPYQPTHSAVGLIIGSRKRNRSRAKKCQKELVLTP